MSRNASALTILVVLAATPTGAETLADARATLDGREVTITGQIGSGLDYSDDEALHFRDAEGSIYPVIFDAGRTARRQLEGCEFQIFGGTPCRFEGRAEIDLDGSRLRLIIFEAADIGPPEALE